MLLTSSCLPERQLKWEQRAGPRWAVGAYVLRDETTTQQGMHKAKKTEACTYGLHVLPCMHGVPATARKTGIVT